MLGLLQLENRSPFVLGKAVDHRAQRDGEIFHPNYQILEDLEPTDSSSMEKYMDHHKSTGLQIQTEVVQESQGPGLLPHAL